MKKQFILLLSLVFIALAVFAVGEGTQGGKSTTTAEIEHLKIQLRKDIAELQTKVAELQTRNQALEERVKTLETSVQQLKQPHLAPLSSQGNSLWVQPPQGPQPEFQPHTLQPELLQPKPPTVWGEREVNGWKFYIVPCEQKAVAAK